MKIRKNIWIRVEYLSADRNCICGCTASIQRSEQLVDIIQRYNLNRKSIIFFYVNDELQNDEKIEEIFTWYEKKILEGDDPDEKRKEAK